MKKIAVVDQEAILSLDLARSIERAGHEPVGPFSSSGDFLRFLDSTKLSLALIDIQGPRFEEYLAAAVEARYRHEVPCVFLTTHADAAVLERTQKAEPLGFLVMPFSERELASTIEIALFRAELEDKLRRSERRYRDLFMRGLSARCLLAENGDVVEKNEAFDTLFKSKREDGHLAIQAFFLAQDDWNGAKLAISAGTSIAPREIAMRAQDGSAVNTLASFSIFDGGAGTEPSILCEFADLSESTRLREELFQAQKMDAMGRLAAGVAHDFNNVLTAIVGHAEILKMDSGPNGAAQEDIEGILSASRKAASLTKQLLAFSRKREYLPAVTDLYAVVRDSAQMLKRLVGESILFSTDLPDGNCYIFADPVQIEQALVNLVVNSRDALEERRGGRIVVTAASEELQAAEKVGGAELPSGSYATVEVSDNGRGIPKNVILRIFEPFFTTKAEGKGTGLGLAIVASIMKNSKGFVGVESDEGKGTAIKLWFPKREQRRLGPKEGRPSGSQSSARHKHLGSADQSRRAPPAQLPRGFAVLLVDDDENILGLLSKVLENAGAKVSTARNAGEAHLLSESMRFDMLIAEIVLPGISGIEVAERLERRSEGLSVLLMTGKIPGDDASPIEGLVREGRFKVLEKPFTPIEFLQAVEGAIKTKEEGGP